jgi:hypothetical protein
LARELLRNFPKGRRGKNRRRSRKGAEAGGSGAVVAVAGTKAVADADAPDAVLDTDDFLDGVIAAAEALGLESVGPDRDHDFDEEDAADRDAA